MVIQWTGDRLAGIDDLNKKNLQLLMKKTQLKKVMK